MGRRILVVDDDVDILSVMEIILSMKGFEVEVSSRGENTFPKVDSFKPDLILLDINLPKIDGLEVLKSIKNDPKLSLIPVIILTTSDDDKDILKSYQAHANCYITKPVSYNSFIDVIKTLNDFWIKIVKLPNV